MKTVRVGSSGPRSQVSGVQVLNRAFDLLECLNDSDTGLTLTEIAKALSLAPSTVHRLLQVMAARGYVEMSPESKRYAVGIKVTELRGQALGRLRLNEVARPYLRQLVEASGERAHLAMLWDGEIVYLESIEETPAFNVFIPVGRRGPIHCTALGKAILAHHPQDQVRKLLTAKGMRRQTPNTIVSIPKYLAELERVRENGFALDNEEARLGVRCLAAPILDHRGEPIAAISMSGNAVRISPDRDLAHGKLVLEAAAAMSKRLGYFARPLSHKAGGL
jgi:DNA-binding IclR family transcriptional regulator